jgi:hypothetical protein
LPVGLGAGFRLVGSRLSPDTRRLRDFLARNRIRHGFLDVDTDQQPESILRGSAVPPSSASPCTRGMGTSIFGRSPRKSVNQVSTQACAANADAPSATMKLFCHACSLMRVPRYWSTL